MATERSKSAPGGPAARLLAAPVDIASLAAFRILFGLLMAAAMVRFLAKGWVTMLYVEPNFHFYYPGFEWIHPWPPFWMHVHFVLLALLAAGVALGFFYRICMALFFLGFVYVELIDQTAYLNHYYLISLLSGLMVFLPAHRAWSFDAWRRPEIRADAIPAWTLNLLRFQVAVVYVFAGLAKFNADWLFRAEPLRIWLAARSDLPLVGPWLDTTWTAYAASWFGAVFDTGIVFFLLNKRTRKAAFVLVVFFHVATWILFNIGMFPWIMIAAAMLFFPADWPRNVLSRASGLARRFNRVRLAEKLRAAGLDNSLGGGPCRTTPLLVSVLGVYAAVQLALPLRSFFCAEPPAWTCAGFNCAWRVMIVEKTGYAEFYAFDPATGKRWELPVKSYLTPRQETLMAQDPYLVREMARRLAADLKDQFPDVQIRVNAYAALDGRPGQRLINPQVDLARAAGSGWILPLEQPAGGRNPGMDAAAGTH
jgi:vitamin K-dependent gamma-carboxylase